MTQSKVSKIEKIAATLAVIQEQTGITLQTCPDFPALYQHKEQQYFNVIIEQRVAESEVYSKLLRFAQKHNGIRFEPNGLQRLAVFI